MILLRCWCWVATGQDSFVAVAEHVQTATVAAQAPFAAMAELALIDAVAD